MEATSERFIVGRFSPDVEAEHMERYRYACRFVVGQKVVDIACGAGYGSRMLADAGAASVQGFDISPEAVEAAQAQYAAPNLNFAQGDAENLSGIPSGTVDVVVSFETIEHLHHVDLYLAEISRILKPGGQYIVSTPDRRLASSRYPLTGKPNNPFHVVEYTEQSLRDVLASRFAVEDFFGQCFVSKLYSFWPLQVLLKGSCFLFRRFGAYRFIRRVYHVGSGFAVQAAALHPDAIARYWVVRCRRAS